MLSLPVPLAADWSMTVTPSGAALTPASLGGDLQWCHACVPGTALMAQRMQERSALDQAAAKHEHDVWYRTEISVSAGETLRFLGLAGLAEIWIDGKLVATSNSMFIALDVTVPPTHGWIALLVRFRSLACALAAPAGRSRWRTRLVTSNGLRRQRQTLLGHMPGWCPELPAIGPYRGIERITGPGTIRSCTLSSSLRAGNGVVRVRITFAQPPGPGEEFAARVGSHVAPIYDDGSGAFEGEVVVPDAPLWWPHTHGTPTLHEVFLVRGDEAVRVGRTGFRSIRIARDDDGSGFGFTINGIEVFCRGACWTSADLTGLRHEREDYERWLHLACEAGMNMVRIGGTMLYEAPAFHELCDELGILVWQDLMFANLDYATEEPGFRAAATLEVEQLIGRLSASPSLAVVCGGSEMAQQAAFMGLDADRRRMEFFEEFLPAAIALWKPELAYVPHTPWGGEPPSSVGVGVTHYYGVGAYRRPLDDARRAGVRFATECLAFANPPSAGSPSVRLAGSAPRDRGASWDFADIRDHYLRVLYGVDPVDLRSEDPDRYLDLSRAVTAELMEAVFSEWRRPGSGCRGGLVWQLQDIEGGSFWGVIDRDGFPKAAWHGLARVFAPVQVLLSDEGLDGLGVHVVNETAFGQRVTIELACLRRGMVPVASGERSVEVGARGDFTIPSGELLGRFFDINRAYRFGPAEHTITIATLRQTAPDGSSAGRILSEAFHFPSGRELPLDDLGLQVSVSLRGGDWVLEVLAERFAESVHVEADGYRAETDWFHLPPGRTRRLLLLPDHGRMDAPRGTVAALNGMQVASFRGTP